MSRTAQPGSKAGPVESTCASTKGSNSISETQHVSSATFTLTKCLAPGTAANLDRPPGMVAYCSYEGTGRLSMGVDEATHYLTISRLNAQMQDISIFVADCSVPGWTVWGSDVDTTPSTSGINNTRTGENKPPITERSHNHCGCPRTLCRSYVQARPTDT